MTTVLFSLLALGGIAFVFGGALSYANKMFKTEEDPKIAAMRASMPGVNCGGCGFAGCEAFMRAVSNENVNPETCPVLSPESLEEIGRITGMAVTRDVKLTAFIRCAGDDKNSRSRYEYRGLDDCAAMSRLVGGGYKTCPYGCLGGSTCEKACKFGAIKRIGGIAAVDETKCAGCGVCVKACPKKIIGLIPAGSEIRIACASHETAAAVKRACTVGCIGCGICARVCVKNAITIENALAKIDYSKCDDCGACKSKCPAGCIV